MKHFCQQQVKGKEIKTKTTTGKINNDLQIDSIYTFKKVKGRTTKRKHPPQKATQPFPMVHALVKYREFLTKR